MKLKRYLISTFCLCLFTACDGDDNLLCYGTHTESKVMLPHSELLVMERQIVRKPLIVQLPPYLPKGEWWLFPKVILYLMLPL